jgi:ABC-type multidrug transport system fused ATPase/permease subunit
LTKGNIFIDNKPIGYYSKQYLRQNIGIVEQEPFLFSTRVNLLARFYEPKKGRILINGRDYTEYSLKSPVKIRCCSPDYTSFFRNN